MCRKDNTDLTGVNQNIGKRFAKFNIIKQRNSIVQKSFSDGYITVNNKMILALNSQLFKWQRKTT